MWKPDPSIIITAEQKRAEQQSVLLNSFRVAVQSLLDAKAQEKQYDNGFTVASYVVSTNPIWKAEAEAFVAWRDAVWGYALAELDKVQSGTREIPTLEAFLEELPPFEWPTAAE